MQNERFECRLRAEPISPLFGQMESVEHRLKRTNRRGLDWTEISHPVRLA